MVLPFTRHAARYLPYASPPHLNAVFCSLANRANAHNDFLAYGFGSRRASPSWFSLRQLRFCGCAITAKKTLFQFISVLRKKQRLSCISAPVPYMRQVGWQDNNAQFARVRHAPVTPCCVAPLTRLLWCSPIRASLVLPPSCI